MKDLYCHCNSTFPGRETFKAERCDAKGMFGVELTSWYVVSGVVFLGSRIWSGLQPLFVNLGRCFPSIHWKIIVLHNFSQARARQVNLPKIELCVINMSNF